ncbi:LutB/LldF family L-lactate oxidation iron-sulfur protein [Puniceicoccus vermicola]|uniref:Iron-sulfur cluster-binding protein n=1 Tax=Puniceicoccus vermicola TaxID=388746 RepID=A0A7X1B1W2_9BACT|nr:LutB/LldF family L-lactate oxidation iron-sulfur protein [Puniceicoccus vermicola]MBC2604007.1 iron-sulfur cluster-binding protein [Puniceicoccus vermicola]
MSSQIIDQFAADLDGEVRTSVRSGSAAGTDKRHKVLFEDFPEADRMRELAGKVKQHTLDHLDKYLEQAEAALKANGAKVHFAWDAKAACDEVEAILRQSNAKTVTKSKSMVSEEVGLNDSLAERGFDVVETDLGEFILQLDGDHPSHVVKPIIHKNRSEIARTFEKHGLGEYNDEPETITRRARQFMRKKYLQAEATITGANFVSAESGRMCVVTNEGNSRFGLAGSRVHIALVGIEKIVPRDIDLSLLLNLLGRSATGQALTVYTEFIAGPKAEGAVSGPEEFHVVFVNNRRTEVLASNCREILRCIRCGACMNVCPVYRQASGHAYRSVYPGPLGAVLSPLLAGAEGFPELADLPKASSLCGACNEVCPVDIPIPDLLLKLRDRGKQEHNAQAAADTPPMGAWAWVAQSPALWRASLKSANMLNLLPYEKIPFGPLGRWTRDRTLPAWRGGKFRSWAKNRKKAAK